MTGLARKRVLGTGGTTGIGLAIARRLAEEGARLFVVGREAADLDPPRRRSQVPERRSTASRHKAVSNNIEHVCEAARRSLRARRPGLQCRVACAVVDVDSRPGHRLGPGTSEHCTGSHLAEPHWGKGSSSQSCQRQESLSQRETLAPPLPLPVDRYR
jgi:NAD(P)-dependent dehydrogenase (short-subunit alcohol dehydrogenase family)